MVVLLYFANCSEKEGCPEGKAKGILTASINFSEGRMEEAGELDHYIGVDTTRKEWAPF